MTIWFVIYMTFSGWRVAQIQPVPGLEEGCYLSRPGSEFCIVEARTDPGKKSAARKAFVDP